MPELPPKSEWTPHMWEGCCFSAWVRILATNRFAVHPRYWWVAGIVTVVSFLHSVMWLIENALLRQRYARTPTPRDPIFILGHWRTGTTLLHELLIHDERHCFPNTYQCMEPNHFHLTEKFFTLAMPFLISTRRPMDDMAAGWDRPQEDEFALCMMGQPSPYTHIAFPNRPPADIDAIDFRNFSDAQVNQWAKALQEFLRRVSSLHPKKRLILKSPPHTARIAPLLKYFPEARFVHIVRDPFVVYGSTKRLWAALYERHTLQTPDQSQLESFVVNCGKRLYDRLDADRKLVPPERFHELRFEDLIRDPVNEMRELYRRLDLGHFEKVQAKIEAYFLGRKDYRPNRHQMSKDTNDIVRHHWQSIVQRFENGRGHAGGATSPVRAQPVSAA